MASIKIVLRDNKINSAGKAPLFIRIIHQRRMNEVALNKSIDPKFWDKDREQIKKGYHNPGPVNVYLRNEKRAYESIIDNKLAKGETFTIKDIINEKKGISPAKEEVIQVSFNNYLKNYILENPDKLGYNTLVNYRSTHRRLNEFNDSLSFEAITSELLKEFENFLTKTGNKTNTIWGRMKVIRKMMRLAIQQGLSKNNPFQFYKLKKEESKRAFLTREQIALIESFETDSRNKTLARDLFLFGCFTGLRFSDICTLKKDSVTFEQLNEETIARLSTKMKKTNQVIAFKFNKKAIALIKKYEDEVKASTVVFPIISQSELEKSEDELDRIISSRNAYTNTLLREIFKALEISGKLSFHSSRHTFATISLSIGMPAEIVMKLLGHKDMKTTLIYANIMDKNKDAASDLWDQI